MHWCLSVCTHTVQPRLRRRSSTCCCCFRIIIIIVFYFFFFRDFVFCGLCRHLRKKIQMKANNIFFLWDERITKRRTTSARCGEERGGGIARPFQQVPTFAGRQRVARPSPTAPRENVGYTFHFYEMAHFFFFFYWKCGARARTQTLNFLFDAVVSPLFLFFRFYFSLGRGFILPPGWNINIFHRSLVFFLFDECHFIL